jgi:hypothetical protein
MRIHDQRDLLIEAVLDLLTAATDEVGHRPEPMMAATAID